MARTNEGTGTGTADGSELAADLDSLEAFEEFQDYDDDGQNTYNSSTSSTDGTVAVDSASTNASN